MVNACAMGLDHGAFHKIHDEVKYSALPNAAGYFLLSGDM